VTDVSSSHISLAWDEPSKDGGSPITGYYVERRQPFSTRWTRVNKKPIASTSYTVKDVVEDTEYEFRIVAENKAGCGKPDEIERKIRTKDPFGE
jgi:titin